MNCNIPGCTDEAAEGDRCARHEAVWRRLHGEPEMVVSVIAAPAVALAVRPLPKVKTLIMGNVGLESYQVSTLTEALERVENRKQAAATVEREIEEAKRGIVAAEGAGLSQQQQQWTTRYWNRSRVLKRRRDSLGRAQNYLELVESGYLPIPTLEGANRLHWLRDPLPPEVLETIAAEKEHGLFTQFQVVGMRNEWESKRQKNHRDPILVGLCDGEMFPLAWWR